MRNLLVIIGIAILGLVAGSYVLMRGPRMTEPTALSSTPAQSTGRYVPYSSDVFAAAADNKRVLYFHADWCPVCRPLDRALSQNPGRIPEGVMLFKTNYDTETALKKQYNITYQHTFVYVDSRGNALETWNGGDVDVLVSKLGELQ